MDAALRAAPHTFEWTFDMERSASMPLETRGVVARYDATEDRLLLHDSTQAPTGVRFGLAMLFGLDPDRVHVVAPDVGGGFGVKVIQFYPEEVLVPWAARRLGVPVKWIEDRREHFVGSNHERRQVHHVRVGAGDDGRILALEDRFVHDTGAYCSYGLILPIITAAQLPGPYRLANYRYELRSIFTNTVPTSPYRGAGRPHAAFVMERVIEKVSGELGLDALEVRRRNFVQPGEFPYHVGVTFQDGGPTIYDSGDYPAGLDALLEKLDLDRTRADLAAMREGGRLVGLGFGAYVEGTGIGPYEGARVTVEPSGRVRLATGVGTQGQGHFTVFAQIVAEVLGVDVTDVHVITGDTREFHWGTGTFASRGAVVAGSACHAAAVAVRAKVLELASRELEAAPADLVLAGGRVHLRGNPGGGITLGSLALKANPLRGAVRPGAEPGLEATAYFGPDRGSTANGVHAMVVEVDPETAQVEIQRYVVVHDCGRVINPMIVEGQIHGGVAHGIGNAFFEQLAYDEEGQLLNASFMDYLLPTATDVPNVAITHRETPSPLNPMGVKGVGEAGAIPTGALFAQAVEDALGDSGVEICEIPLSPNRLFELMSAARSRGVRSR